MEKKSFVLKGNIVYSGENKELCSIEGGYVVCENGICRGAFEKLPKQYETLPLTDYGDKIILPGMTDLHVHAPQYTFRALGMDLELLDWLNVHTFPEEAKYVDISYAKRAYGSFVSDLKHSLTTRACIFATLHREATVALMDLLEESGIVSYVGKVNMDRNGGENLCEADASAAAEDTKKWIEETAGKYERTNPILTPRFIPSCTDELMRELAKLQKTTGLRVQSHLSENPSEVAWVKELVSEREILQKELSALPVILHIYPSDANFLLVKTRDAQALYDYLVAKGIIVRNRNKITLCENCLRITVGTPEENKALIDELKKVTL